MSAGPARHGRVPTGAVLALGLTQVVGYGSLYYAFSVVTPDIGATFGRTAEWAFGALSVALLAGGFLAPLSGRLFDRFGAAHCMAFGSIAGALALAGVALAPNAIALVVALVSLQIASTAALYAAAFAALVQLAGRNAQASITHLTLIGGFASTVFWPLTSVLAARWGWQTTFLFFAAANLFICAPLHWWLANVTRKREGSPRPTSGAKPVASTGGSLSPAQRVPAFVLMVVGFAIEGFILSAVLLHIVPVLDALATAASGVFLVTTLFGPAQVLSRVANMLLGRGLRQTHLAIIAAALPPVAVALLALAAPSAVASVAFALLFGLGSGLTSITAGSLPLELFGSEHYGARLGLLSSSRQVAAAVAPFVLALLMSHAGVGPALWLLVAVGATSVGAFVGVAAISARAPLQL